MWFFPQRQPAPRVTSPAPDSYIKVTVQKMSPNGTVLFTVWGKGDTLSDALYHCRSQTKGMFQAVSATVGEILNGRHFDEET